MQKSAIKEVLYGGLREITTNRQFYHRSSVGSSFSHFTKEGEAEALDFLRVVLHHIEEAEQLELEQLAKDLVINGLKDQP